MKKQNILGEVMKLTRQKLRKMILKEMADMSGGQQAVKDYMHGLPYEPDRVSKSGSHDYNLGDEDIMGSLDTDVYGDDDMSRDRFSSEVQTALDALVAAGFLGRSAEGYYVADGDIITPQGNIDMSDVF